VKNIVILGAGFGGLHTARKIAKGIKRLKLAESYRVILVDKNSFHTFTPTLYEIATTTDQIASNAQLKRIVAFSIKEILGNVPIEFIHGEVTEIEMMGGELKFANGTVLKADWLVLALGSQVNYFNIPGLAEHGLAFKTLSDALHVRERIIEHEEGEEHPCVRIAIGGGGPTGVELAGEIKNLLRELPRIAHGSCTEQVTIIEGAPTILPAFSRRIGLRAEKRLQKLGVTVLTNKKIQAATENEVTLLTGEKIPFDVLIWTGGVAPNHLMSTLQMKKDQSGTRVVASNEMVCLPESEDLKLSGKIFGIGDAVCFIDEKTGKPVPGVARTAIAQGTIAAFNIIQDVMAEQDLVHTVKMKRYHPKEYPYILPIGGKFAIARLGAFIFSGRIAWFIKGLVELNYFFSIFNPAKALKYWLLGLWIFMRNDRLG
jgi:NADH:ubiquinone reductase (H+-translocating)